MEVDTGGLRKTVRRQARWLQFSKIPSQLGPILVASRRLVRGVFSA
jgi:hypothetical protein